VAIFTPVSDSQVHLSVSVRIDKRINAALNNPGGFTGTIGNKANIAMTSQEVAAI
jgi:hypothetical protein